MFLAAFFTFPVTFLISETELRYLPKLALIPLVLFVVGGILSRVQTNKEAEMESKNLMTLPGNLGIIGVLIGLISFIVNIVIWSKSSFSVSVAFFFKSFLFLQAIFLLFMRLIGLIGGIRVKIKPVTGATFMLIAGFFFFFSFIDVFFINFSFMKSFIATLPLELIIGEVMEVLVPSIFLIWGGLLALRRLRQVEKTKSRIREKINNY